MSRLPGALGRASSSRSSLRAGPCACSTWTVAGSSGSPSRSPVRREQSGHPTAHAYSSSRRAASGSSDGRTGAAVADLRAVDAAFRPGTHQPALIRRRGDSSEVVLRGATIFSGRGELVGPTLVTGRPLAPRRLAGRRPVGVHPRGRRQHPSGRERLRPVPLANRSLGSRAGAARTEPASACDRVGRPASTVVRWWMGPMSSTTDELNSNSNDRHDDGSPQPLPVVAHERGRSMPPADVDCDRAIERIDRSRHGTSTRTLDGDERSQREVETLSALLPALDLPPPLGVRLSTDRLLLLREGLDRESEAVRRASTSGDTRTVDPSLTPVAASSSWRTLIGLRSDKRSWISVRSPRSRALGALKATLACSIASSARSTSANGSRDGASCGATGAVTGGGVPPQVEPPEETQALR